MPRTAEVIYVGDASSLIRASQEAAAATEAATGKISSASAKAAGAQEAAATRAAAAHDKMIASAKRSNDAFAKWGTVAAAGVVGGAVDMALKVESAAASIAKASGSTGAAGKQIEDAFRKIPGTVEFSAAKIGSAYATIAGELKTVEGRSLGAAKATQVMKAALELTDATGGELTSTTEALGKVMLTYSLSAGQAAEASDILFNTSKQTGVSVEQVAQTVDRMRGRLGALAPTLGETAGLMEELQKHGVAGRQSLSALNGVFSTLLGGSKSVTGTLKQLNVSIFDSHHKFIGLRGVIEELRPVLAKYDQQSQLAITRTLFGAGANKQLLDIIHAGPGAYGAATKAVEKHGAAAAAAKREHETLAGKLKATRADLENMGATIGERMLPILSKFVGAISGAIKWLDKHKDAAKALAIVVTTVLGAALIDFAVTKAVKFSNSLKTMGDGLKWLATRFGLIPAAAATSAAETAGIQEGLAAKVAASDAAIAGSNGTAAASFDAEAVAAGYGATAAAAAQAGLATKVAASDAAIVAANETAGASWTAMLGPIGAAAAAAYAAWEILNKVLPAGERPENLLGGNQPNEASKEGEVGFKYGNKGLKKEREQKAQHFSDTQGGIMEFFIKKGYSPAAAAGIVGNLMQESSLNPRTNTSEGIGLASWHDPGRQSALKAFAKAQHKSWEDPETQLDFILHERGGVLSQLKGATSPADASLKFNLLYEGGTDPGGVREKYAREAFHKHPVSRQREEAIRGRHEAEGNQEGSEHFTPETAAKKAKKHAKPKTLGRGGKPMRAPMGGPGYEALFHAASGVQQSRVDQGVDYAGIHGAIGAIGEGTITGVKHFEGFGTTIEETLADGRKVYYALETGGTAAGGITGKHVKAGQKIATGIPSGSVEFGFAGADGLPITRYGQGGEGTDHNIATRGGAGFAAFIAKGGVSPLSGTEQITAVSNTKSAAKALKEHAAEMKKHAEAVAKAREKLAEQVAKWKETFEGLAEKMKELAGSAAQAWNTLQTKAIGATHAGRLKELEGGPEATSLHGEEATDKRLARERTEASNAKALKEAKATGDKTKIREAEETITDFARAQDEERKRDYLEAAKKAADEKEESDLQRLEKETAAYEENLNKQLEALNRMLKEGRISYAAYVQDIMELLAGTGVTFKGDKATGETIAGGPGAPYPNHPVEGTYSVGPHGERIYHAPTLQETLAAPPAPVPVSHGTAPPGMEWTDSGGGGWVPIGTKVVKSATINMSGPVTMGSTKDAQMLASRLAFRIKHG